MIILFFIDIISFHKNKHLDYKSSISSIGILGTFLGIFIGLLRFNSNNIEQSIPYLLEGLKIAFFTSVLGIFLATILNIFETRAK